MSTVRGLDRSQDCQQVGYAVAGGVARLSLNRPGQLNAFTDAMERELIECFDRTDSDDAVRVVVLTGVERAFCAGMDLSESVDPGDALVDWRRSPTAPAGTQVGIAGSELPLRRDGGGRVALRIFELHKPIISAINGHASGWV